MSALLWLALSCQPRPEDTAAPDDSGESDVDDTSDSDPGDDTDPTALSGEATFGAFTVRWSATGHPLRTYTLRSDAPLRDNQPPGGVRTFSEPPGQPRLRSGNGLIDALFALAVVEAAENSVSEITDGAFANGAPTPCPCFETGAKWTYVWTRDTAFAAELGLAWLDPARAAASLAYKRSNRKASFGGGQPEIVQDTGTGGSWPVSTDRVSWALGAWQTFLALPPSEAGPFAAAALDALANTLETDRRYAYDPAAGLYRGETSFLDWREQTYPAGTASDTLYVGTSRALSTNLLHLAAMRIGSRFASRGGRPADASRWDGWADALGAQINRTFWDEEAQLYRSYVGAELDPAPVSRYDALGNALAVEWLAEPSRAREILSAWPFAPGGPPVVWPQQPLRPVYHNRGAWPFVTAWLARAAARAEHPGAVNAASEALIRGAALNLSHMENLEFLTGAAWVEDGAYSGPVVNSQRQLWSVAGLLSVVVDTWLGRAASPDGLRFTPALPGELREGWFAASDEVVLHDLPTPNGPLDVHLALPPGPVGPGRMVVSGATVDGAPLAPGALVPAGARELVLSLAAPSVAGPAVRRVDGSLAFQHLYSPRDPSLSAPEVVGDDLRFALDAGGETGVEYRIFRDGVLVADEVSGPTWTDPGGALAGTRCYAVETQFTVSGHRSQHSAPQCWWGPGYARIRSVTAADFRAVGGSYVVNHGRGHFEGWGEPNHTLEADFIAGHTGAAWVQLVYGNGSGPLNTGIGAGHKWVRVFGPGGVVAGEGPVLMPQLGAWDRWADSSLVPAQVVSGQPYTVHVSDAPNMTWFEHFGPYTGGSGGGPAGWNRVNVSEIKLLGR